MTVKFVLQFLILSKTIITAVLPQVVVDKEYSPGKPVLVVKLPGTNPELPAGKFLYSLGLGLI